MQYSDDELRARINQGLMSEAELDAIPMERMRAMAQADMAEQTSQQIQEHQKAEAVTAAAEKANAAELLAWKNRAPEPVSAEKYENLTALEIEALERGERARAEELSQPQAILEQEAQSAEQRVADLQYIEEQLRKKTGPQLQEAISAEVARQQAVINDSLALQRQWVAGHPEYITSPENGDLMRDFVRGNGYSAFSLENLELAYQVLRQQGKLKLLNSEQVAARQQLQTAVQTGETPRPKRAASSVSARDNVSEGGFYTPRPQREIDPETIPLDQLRTLIDQNADPRELAEERRRGQALGRF